MAIGIARFNVYHPLEFLIHRLQAPETTAGEGGKNVAGSRFRSERVANGHGGLLGEGG
jgi:hypothetical protein